MGIQCYNREILRMASDASGIHERLFGAADEHLKSSLLYRITKKVYNYQAKILKELAEEESYVAIGRCADYVLKDYDNVISVFIHAPFDFCLEQAMKLFTKTEDEMRRYIQKRDKYRGEYYKYYTGQEWYDARNYDLCLDSSKLGFDGCVEAIKAYMKVRGIEAK